MSSVILDPPAAEAALNPRCENTGDLFDGRFLHACPMTGKSIDEFDDDIIHCRCYESADFLEVQDNRAVLMDARRAERE